MNDNDKFSVVQTQDGWAVKRSADGKLAEYDMTSLRMDRVDAGLACDALNSGDDTDNLYRWK